LRTIDGILIGYQVVRTRVSWFPKASLQRDKGMHILKSQPSQLFEADTFISGSRKRLEKVVESVKENFKFNAGRDFNPCIEWENFALIEAPKSDDVNDYTKVKGLHCPLASYLLGYEEFINSSTAKICSDEEKYMPCAETGNQINISININCI
jgi:hypothetical protein